MSEAERKVEVEMGQQVQVQDRREPTAVFFERYVQPCLVELLGTSLFVFVGCASVVGNAGMPGVTQPALAHGLTLAAMIVMFGQVSGGHFNPAVSLCACLCGGMELRLLPPYVVAQLSGGTLGAALTRGVFAAAGYAAARGGAFDLGSSDVVAGALAEVTMTVALTLAVCMGAINGRTRSVVAPFCIGITVTANIFAGGSLTGACMNPARAFGPAVAANHWSHHWIYWVGPTCGALLTAGLVRFLFGDQKTRIVLK